LCKILCWSIWALEACCFSSVAHRTASLDCIACLVLQTYKDSWIYQIYPYLCKSRTLFSLVHAMQTYGRVQGQFHVFSISVLCPTHTAPGKNSSWYSLTNR
jgi:hypothetical protein